MLPARNTVSFLILGAYLSLLVVFVFAFTGLVQLQSQEPDAPQLATLEHLRQASLRETKVVKAETFGFVSQAGRKPAWIANDSYNAITIRKPTSATLLLAICAVAFLVAYIGAPVYMHHQFVKPARTLEEKLAQSEPLHDKNQKAFGSASMTRLANRVQETIKAQNMVADYVNSPEEFDNTIVAQHGDTPVMKLLVKMQQQLDAVSAQEKSTKWVNENLNKFEKILKEESDAKLQHEQLIRLMSTSINAGVGFLYDLKNEGEHSYFIPLANYGFYDQRSVARQIPLGEGQLGEAGRSKRTVVLENVPKNYLVIHSGMGSASASHILIIPLLFKNELYGAVEFASFHPFETQHIQWLEKACESLAAHFFNQKVNAAAKQKLETLAKQQAEELVRIHQLEEATRHQLENKLHEVESEKRKHEAILNGCVDAVISFKGDGMVCFANDEAVSLLGYAKEDLLGQSITMLMPIDFGFDGNQFKCTYKNSSEAKPITIRTEVALRDRQGNTLDVLVTSSHVTVGDDIVVTFFVQKISVDLF